MQGEELGAWSGGAGQSSGSLEGAEGVTSGSLEGAEGASWGSLGVLGLEAPPPSVPFLGIIHS